MIIFPSRSSSRSRSWSFPPALQKLPQHSLRYSLLQQSPFEGTSPVEFIPQQRCFPIEVGTSAEVFPQQIIWSIVPQRSLFLPYYRTPQQFFLQGSNPQSRLSVLETWSDSASEDYGWIYSVFANRLSATHKHSSQALVVYIHDDHTVKINPLICGPLWSWF